MVKKIISGGQTGADRAALDVSIKLGIPHAGWIPKGRLTEEGPLPNKYQLQQMPTRSYPARTEQNVIDADGTLIITRGKPTGGSAYTRQMVLKHKRQLFHIDLDLTTSFDAASLILSWIKLQRIKILNVAGPRAGKDADIYKDVFRILEMAFKMDRIEESRPANKSKPVESPRPLKPPKNVAEAVEKLTSELSLKDKTTIAHMAEHELSTLRTNLGEYIRNEFGLRSGNKDLMTSCCFVAQRDKVHEDGAASIIIKELWKKLRETKITNLTKAHIVESIAEQNGFPKNKSTETLEILLEIIKSTLASGEDVLIRGFGKFCVKEKRERKGRNPSTGEAMMLAPRRVVTFKCAGKLRDKINRQLTK